MTDKGDNGRYKGAMGRSTPALPQLRMIKPNVSPNNTSVSPSNPQKMTLMEMTRLKAPDYMQECDTAEVVRVKLVASDPRSVPQVIALKSGETIQNIKKKILSTKGVNFGYSEFELLYQDHPVCDPLSLQDVSGLVNDPHPVLKVVLKNRAPLFLPPLESSVGGSEIEVMPSHNPNAPIASPSAQSVANKAPRNLNTINSSSPSQVPPVMLKPMIRSSSPSTSEDDTDRSRMTQSPPGMKMSSVGPYDVYDEEAWSEKSSGDVGDDGEYVSSSSSSSLSEGCVEVRVEDVDEEDEEEEKEEKEDVMSTDGASINDDDDEINVEIEEQQHHSGHEHQLSSSGASTAEMYKKESPVFNAQPAFQPSNHFVMQQNNDPQQHQTFFSFQQQAPPQQQYPGEEAAFQAYASHPYVLQSNRRHFNMVANHNGMREMTEDMYDPQTSEDSVKDQYEEEEGVVNIEVESDVDSYSGSGPSNPSVEGPGMHSEYAMVGVNQFHGRTLAPSPMQNEHALGAPLTTAQLPAGMKQIPGSHGPTPMHAMHGAYQEIHNSTVDLTQNWSFVPMINNLMQMYASERKQNSDRLQNLMRTADFLQKQLENYQDELARDEVRELSSRVGKERSSGSRSDSLSRELNLTRESISSNKERMKNLTRRIHDLDSRTVFLQAQAVSQEQQIVALRRENAEFQRRIATVQQLINSF